MKQQELNPQTTPPSSSASSFLKPSKPPSLPIPNPNTQPQFFFKKRKKTHKKSSHDQSTSPSPPSTADKTHHTTPHSSLPDAPSASAFPRLSFSPLFGPQSSDGDIAILRTRRFCFGDVRIMNFFSFGFPLIKYV